MNPTWTFPLIEGDALRRRSFVRRAGSLALASWWSMRADGTPKTSPVFSAYPFALGVASGDPAPDGFVLWTRLAPAPLEGGGMPPEPVEVAWDVAEDEGFSRMVQQGRAVAVPEWAHSVHVEVEGLLPGRWYWYRFRAGDALSPPGRTRTLPAPGATPGLKFAFASCQHYETGLYTAYEHMLREEPELVVHLGDYIYEYPGEDKRVRKHVGPLLNSLGDYRNRIAQYKTDPALQAMHAAAPWVVTWDDHEFADNYAGAIPARGKETREEFLAHRARAYQAYYEHMPLRRRSLPRGPDMELHRRLSFGNLADFHVLDTRQYRTDQPCGDGNKPPCPEASLESATLLGAPQREWLCAGLGASTARWNVLAQQVMMARVDRNPTEAESYSMDQWPGYEADRLRVLGFLRERKVANPVVLTGDIHSNWANNLSADAGNPNGLPVAAEFVGTSISSGGDGAPAPKTLDALLAQNPFVKFHNTERGYVLCTLTPTTWRTDYRTVAYVTRPGAPLQTRASFVLEAGVPGLQRA